MRKKFNRKIAKGKKYIRRTGRAAYKRRAIRRKINYKNRAKRII